MKLKYLKTVAAVAAISLGAASQANALGVVTMSEFAVNINGTVYNPIAFGDVIPGSVSVPGTFTFGGSGLGTLTYTVGSVGLHHFSLFVDHEIDEADNTFFNEVGSAIGAPAAGQTWEIDEPGFVFGDIYDNLSDSDNDVDGSDLDNSVGEVDPEDVSMALGWDFTLAAGETATIKMILSASAPGSGFYLTQFDSDSDFSIYFNSTLDITGTPPPPGVPDGGATAVMLFLGMLGLCGFKKFRTR